MKEDPSSGLEASALSGEGYQETGIQDTAGTPETKEELRGAKEYAEMIVDTVREGLLVLDLDLRVMSANQSFYDSFDVDPEETVGRKVYELMGGQWDIPELRRLLEEILPENKVFDDYEVEHDFEGIGRRVMLLNARRLDDHELILLAIEDNTERRKREEQIRQLNETLEERVEKRTHEVRRLASQLTMAEQRERRRIAAVLHDELQQLIYDAEMTGRRLRRELPEQGATFTADMLEERTAMLDQIEEVLSEAVEGTQGLSKELSPPELQSDDLASTLRWLAGHMEERFDLSVEVRLGDFPPMASPDLHTLVFRLLRELLFNVVKHAEVDHTTVEAHAEDGRLHLKVEDEGVGFDPARLEEGQRGLGLSDMHERLEVLEGRLEVESAPGEGTRVRITLPDAFGEEA